MQWLMNLGQYVWQFIALLVGLVLLFGPIQEVANSFGKYVATNSTLMVGVGVLVIAVAAVRYVMGGDGGSGQSS